MPFELWCWTQDKFKDLTGWWKEVLGTSVTGVKVSSRLAKSPAIVVTSQYGWSANMERIMKSQVPPQVPLWLDNGTWRSLHLRPGLLCGDAP